MKPPNADNKEGQEGQYKDMPNKLRQLRRTHEGITFTRPDGNPATDHIIGLVDGAIIGGIYRINKRIGRGAMGEVYLAEHIMLDKQCALKVIPPEQVTAVAWERFKIEAKAVARLDHINLVKVSDLGIHEECLPFYAMEYVDGETLEELLAEQKTLPLNTVLEIFKHLCDGLDYAHQHNIVHRDLKPANIMLATGPIGKDAVKVLDFGLAKLIQQGKNKQHLTSAGEIFGSPLYMSPEQCRGDTIDSRSDIYSLGCTLFECLTGRTPFTGNLAAALLYSHENTRAPSLESVAGAKHFPEAMEVVMAKLLHKKPGERYQTMAEVGRDLDLVSRGESILSDEGKEGTEGRGGGGGSADIDGGASGSRAKRATGSTGGAGGAGAGGVGSKVADSLALIKPPTIVWSLVSVLMIGLVGAYWFYTQHTDAQYAATPVLMTDEVPPSIKDKDAFSSIVERNNRRLRRFNFPVDVCIGQIRSASNLVVVPARGQVEFRDTDQVYFVPDSILAKYPGYLNRFRPGDIYGVSIANFDNSDNLLKVASTIPDVEKLTIYRCQSVTGDGLKAIQQYDHLVDLDCSYNQADIANIRNISRLKELKTLRLSGENNVYPVIEKLGHSNQIKELYLDDCPMTPQLVAAVASLPHLTTLSLNSNKLTDQELTALSKCSSLRFLSILKTPITEKTAAIIKSFPALKVLKIIAEPNVASVSNPQLEDLRHSLPALKVY